MMNLDILKLYKIIWKFEFKALYAFIFARTHHQNLFTENNNNLKLINDILNIEETKLKFQDNKKSRYWEISLDNILFYMICNKKRD